MPTRAPSTTWREASDDSELKLLSSYAHSGTKGLHAERFHLGDGLVGQCAVEKKRILLVDVPPDFITISSSLGEARQVSIIVLPVLFEGETKAVIELATLGRFSGGHLAFLGFAHSKHRRGFQYH